MVHLLNQFAYYS